VTFATGIGPPTEAISLTTDRCVPKVLAARKVFHSHLFNYEGTEATGENLSFSCQAFLLARLGRCIPRHVSLFTGRFGGWGGERWQGECERKTEGDDRHERFHGEASLGYARPLPEIRP